MVVARCFFFQKNPYTVKIIQEFKTVTQKQISTTVPKYTYSSGLQLPPAEYTTTAFIHLKPGNQLGSNANQFLKYSTLQCNSRRHPVMQGS